MNDLYITEKPSAARALRAGLKAMGAGALRKKLGELRHEVEVLKESAPSDNVVYMTTKEQQEKR